MIKNNLITVFFFSVFLVVLSTDLKAAKLSDITYCGGKFRVKSEMSMFEKLRCKTEDVTSSLNPIDYFEKRKECLRRKDNADTVAIGKRVYKNCMGNN